MSCEQVLFNLPAGNFAAGDRGMANDPSRVEEFRAGVQRRLEDRDRARLRTTELSGRAATAATCPRRRRRRRSSRTCAMPPTPPRSVGVLQVVEPLNAFDAPGYFLPTPESGFAIVERAEHPNLRLQYDVYHAQRMSGNLAATIAARIDLIGHVQIADSPARNEPGTGEINYPFVLQALDDAGYDGWVSLEYRPRQSTEASLRWLTEMGYWAPAARMTGEV